MAKNTLPTDFQDDIINSSMGGKRRYRMINNSDGTISLEDATTYDQVGSNFGAGQMNATNEAVNESADKNKVIQDIEAIRNVTEDGYIAGALALKQMDSSLTQMQQSFQDGCNTIYNAIVAKGVTPASKSPSDIATAISSITTDVKHSVYAKLQNADTSSFRGEIGLYVDGVCVAKSNHSSFSSLASKYPTPTVQV